MFQIKIKLFTIKMSKSLGKVYPIPANKQSQFPRPYEAYNIYIITSTLMCTQKQKRECYMSYRELDFSINVEDYISENHVMIWIWRYGLE